MNRQIGRLVLLIFAALIIGTLAWLWWARPMSLRTPSYSANATPVPSDEPRRPFALLPASDDTPPLPSPSPVYIGPRENIPDDAPLAYGFWSFAVPVPGVLSRSGQPLIGEFEWLRDQGWHSVVNLRVDGERDEVGDDAKLPGFTDLELTYLHLPITDGHPPTNEQAEAFLAFVTNPVNQPAHVHCRGGIGRAGTLTALYRYAVDGWPLDDAVAESRPFHGGISSLQLAWLESWAAEHKPGSHALN